MPKEEQAICKRLLAWRLMTGLSQAELAGLVGLDVRAYASYEYARSRLNYPAAWKLLTFFRQLNPQWLAEGKGQMVQWFDFEMPAPESLETGPRAPFSSVFREQIKGPLSKAKPLHLVQEGIPVRLFPMTPDASGRLFAKDRFGSLLLQWLSDLPDVAVESFMDKLFRRLAALYARWPRDPDKEAVQRRRDEIYRLEMQRRLPTSEESGKTHLTEAATADRTPEVKSPLANLRARLNTQTSEPGKKSELAEYLGAPLPSVSRWLSGDREPGGEITLKMLHWVELQERK